MKEIEGRTINIYVFSVAEFNHPFEDKAQSFHKTVEGARARLVQYVNHYAIDQYHPREPFTPDQWLESAAFIENTTGTTVGVIEENLWS